MHKSSQAHDPISVLLYNVPPFFNHQKVPREDKENLSHCDIVRKHLFTDERQFSHTCKRR